MKEKIYIIITFLIILSVSLFTIFGCANRGQGPQGGPKDLIPPKYLKSIPEQEALNVTTPTVELFFDEIVLVESSFEKVIISPPQKTAPTIKALGKKVKVQLRDSLLPNTTYTIDFTDAIVDNNERNKLEDFTFCFATGDHIDSLKISGFVVDAQNLNPVPGILVGVHSNLDDTAFTKIPFNRITKTNSRGEFTISNIAEGTYKIFALSDIGSNYFFDIPTEQIGFIDSLFIPQCSVSIHYDTLFTNKLDSVTGDTIERNVIDTIIPHIVHNFTPDSVLLQVFTEKNHIQNLLKSERPERHKVATYYNISCDTLPILRPLDVPDSIFNNIMQINETKDTIVYWFSDSLLIQRDTLQCELTYRKTINDTLRWQTDTLNFIYRAPRGKQTTEKPEERLFKHNASSSFDVYKPLQLTFIEPVHINDTVHYQLQHQVDTIWEDLNSQLVKIDSIGLRYQIEYKWKPETRYRLMTDSALFVSFSGKVTKAEKMDFTIKSLEEYSTFIVELKQHTGKERLQLLNDKDIVVKELPANEKKIKFEYIAPGVYYLRMYIDEDGDGKWSTGKYADHRQAEQVYYFPYSVELRAFWDVEEEWDIMEFPLLQQKPTELINTKDKKK